MKKTSIFLILIFIQSVFSQQKKKDTTQVQRLEEVVIRNKDKIKSQNTNSDIVIFSQEQIKKSISLAGETDPIKLIQLSSGVQSGAEGQSGFIVRGGNQSMNLVYLDDIYLHNVSHIGGFFPLLNSDYIRNMTFYKGGFDAENGGRLSSIIKINTKNTLGKNKVVGSLGLLSAKVTSAIHLKKWKTKVLISGRRTYLELINALMGKNKSVLGEGKGYYFYDYLIKIETQLDSRNKIVFTNFNTKDDYTSDEEAKQLDLTWGNTLFGLSWNYNSFSKFKNQLTLSNSDFGLKNSVSDFPFNYSFSSNFNIYTLKNTSRIALEKHNVDFGVELNKIKNTPKDVRADVLGETALEISNDNEFDLLESSIFFQDLWRIKENIHVKTGLRFTSYQYDKQEAYQDWYLEPRISFHYEFKENNAFKFSYQSLKQYLHQARINTFSLPIDYYIPTNSNLNFQKSHQLSSGYYFDKNKILGEVSMYYKKIDDYSEFKNGALNNLFNNDLYNDVVTGELYSYGVETRLEARFHKLNAVLNYTYSRSKAKFKEINNGNIFPVVFDRPHNLNLALTYKLKENLIFNGLFVYTSGQNYTPIKDIRVINEYPVLNYGAKNSARFPDYHRLDIGVTYLLKDRGDYKSSLNLTFYNAYNRKNTFYIYHEIEGEIGVENLEIKSFYENIFPIIPSLTWNFSF